MEEDFIYNEVEKHKKTDRPYPRPTYECTDCSGTLILCYGDQINPYVRHKTKNKNINSNGCSANLESCIHKYAKKLLCIYLNRKIISKNVIYNDRCYCKSINNIEQYMDLTLDYKEEVTYKNIRFDIAGINKNNEIKFGIEIYYKHKTINIDDRNDIPWIEIDAYEIIKFLDVNNVPLKLILNNIRTSVIKCDNKICMPNRDLSREVLYKYIQNKNNIIIYTNNCHCKSYNIIDIYVNMKLKFNKKILYNDVIIDIGGFDENNNLQFGIICDKEISKNISIKDIQWVLVDPDEIIKIFNAGNISNLIRLNNIKKDIISCDYKYCLPMIELAEKIGYISLCKAYETDSRKLIDCAIKGKYKKDVYR